MLGGAFEHQTLTRKAPVLVGGACPIRHLGKMDLLLQHGFTITLHIPSITAVLQHSMPWIFNIFTIRKYGS